MSTFNIKPITREELLKWHANPKKNPRTNRKIGPNGDLYKFLKSSYEKEFDKMSEEEESNKKIKMSETSDKVVTSYKAETSYKLEDSIDDKDPITLNIFWKIENNIKTIIYENLNDLILYKDIRGLIRCFEKESLSYMKAHKITKHPVSQEEIPNSIFELIEEVNLNEERKKMTVEEKALEIFQKFLSISIFIDSLWFTTLSKDSLKKFNYELSSFFRENFNKSQRDSIGKNLLSKSDGELASMELKEIQLYLLNEIDIILSVQVEDLKYMCNYILVGALGCVIPDINELYPDFSFSFK